MERTGIVLSSRCNRPPWTGLASTPEKNGIICSIVTDDRSFEDVIYMDFDPEEDFGTIDVLDLEYLYLDEAEKPRRKKKGDFLTRRRG